MPDQLNIAELSQKSTPLESDHMLIWSSTVDELTDLQYVTYGQLAASVALIVEDPVKTALQNSFVNKPINKTLAANDIIYYNGSTWIASQTLPTTSVGTTELANGAVTADKLGTNAVTNIKVSAVDASKITTGTLDQDRLPSTINANKIVSVSSSTIEAAAVPSIDASKITTGTLGTSRIPDLSAAKITSGTLQVAQGGTGAGTQVGALGNLKAYSDSTGASGYRIFISTTEPGGATNGDIWFQI